MWELKKMLIKCQGWSLTHLNLSFYSRAHALLLPKRSAWLRSFTTGGGREEGRAGLAGSFSPGIQIRPRRVAQGPEKLRRATKHPVFFLMSRADPRRGRSARTHLLGWRWEGTCLTFHVKKGMWRRMAQRPGRAEAQVGTHLTVAHVLGEAGLTGPRAHTQLFVLPFCIPVPNQGPTGTVMATWGFC